MGSNPLRRNNFIFCTASTGSYTAPAQYPFTKTFVNDANKFGVHSSNNFILTFSRNHLIMSSREYPWLIYVVMAKCLCKPMFPPSGVSIGSKNPHCVLCNTRGPTTFTLASNGRFVLRKWLSAELKDKRFKSCTTPTRFVCSLSPQLPLNAFLNPASTMRLPNTSLYSFWINPYKLSAYNDWLKKIFFSNCWCISCCCFE